MPVSFLLVLLQRFLLTPSSVNPVPAPLLVLQLPLNPGVLIPLLLLQDMPRHMRLPPLPPLQPRLLRARGLAFLARWLRQPDQLPQARSLVTVSPTCSLDPAMLLLRKRPRRHLSSNINTRVVPVAKFRPKVSPVEDELIRMYSLTCVEFTKCLDKADLPSCTWYLEQLKAVSMFSLLIRTSLTCMQCQAAAAPY